MQLLQQTHEAMNERKFMKSQMEKRRRERMNHSLERLRTMLLQEPQQLGAQHRVEKAEILERAVLFLQKTRASAAAAASSSSSSDGADAGRGQKHTFRDGFSSCLQTAARFLEPDGKGPWLRAALGASVAGHPDSDPAAGVQGRPGDTRPGDTRPGDARASSSSSLSHTKSILRSLRQKSKHRPHVPHTGASEPCGCPTRRVRTQKSLQMRRAGKQSPSRSGPVNRALWRPWP
ncbi:transcription factor HES-5-like [Pungitius pungitius]|uniref:transcription factor HES-5-like n=1 Tax=Pungitius pungitius TaxID=134920 RepID=UPI002E12E055